MMPLRPRPLVDRDSAEWWAGLARHELLLQRCADCGTRRWPARALCGRCGALEWGWEPASGQGRVASWIVNRHGFGGAFPLPSTVVLVRLAEQDDLLLPGGWAGSPEGTDLAIGMPVSAGFDDVPADEGGEAMTLLCWRPS